MSFHNIPPQIGYNSTEQLQLPRLNFTTVDEANYHLWYLRNYAACSSLSLTSIQLLQFAITSDNISNYNDYINNEIHRIHNFAPENIKNFIYQANAGYKNKQQSMSFDENELLWLKKDSRACYWFWKKISVTNFYLMPNLNYPLGEWANFYQKLSLSPNPVGNQVRYSNILKFFRDAPIADRKLFWNQSKYQWDLILASYSKPLSWIKENDIQRKWAINYIYDNFSFLKNDVYQVATFETETDLPLSILIDQLQLSPLEKKEFLRTMNSAWNQTKVRKKKEDKKAINAYLSKEHKNRLDEISKNNKQSIEKTIEMLIDHYIAYIQNQDSVDA